MKPAGLFGFSIFPIHKKKKASQSFIHEMLNALVLMCGKQINLHSGLSFFLPVLFTVLPGSVMSLSELCRLLL